MKLSKEEFVKLALDRQKRRVLEQKEKERQAIKDYLNSPGYLYKVQSIRNIGAHKSKKRLTGYPMGKIYNH